MYQFCSNEGPRPIEREENLKKKYVEMLFIIFKNISASETETFEKATLYIVGSDDSNLFK